VLLKGIGFTLALFAITIVTSIPLGLGLTFLANSRIKPVSLLTRAYVLVMRGTPLMLQLFFFYFGLPFLPYVGKYLIMDRFPAACLTFALNYAAYFCEIFRGGLMSIDKGQYEAARVLGLSSFQTTFRIVLPQMVKVVLPAVANEAITLVKDTALASAIGISDLMHYTRSLVNSRAEVTPFFFAAVFYLLFTVLLTRLFSRLEEKFKF